MADDKKGVVPVLTRPQHISAGKPTAVWVNAYEAVAVPTGTVYHYDVTIEQTRPTPRTKQQRGRGGPGDTLAPEIGRQVIDHMDKQRMFQYELNGQLCDTRIGFDGRKNIYSPRQLVSDVGQIIYGDAGKTWDVSVHLGDDEPGNRNRSDTVEFRVKLSLVSSILLDELKQFISGRGSEENDIVQQCLMALNCMINHAPWLKYPSKKTSFFPAKIQSSQSESMSNGGGRGRGGRGDYGGDRGSRGRGNGRGGYGGRDAGPALVSPVGAYVISKGIEMWRGYYTSLRPGPGRLIINIDTTHQPFIIAGNLTKVAMAILGVSNERAVLDCARDRNRTWIDLARTLQGCEIRAEQGRGNFVRRKIKEIGKVPADHQMFDMEGRSISVSEYWNRHHNIRLQHGHDLPCVRVSAIAWYPFETCEIKIGNKYNKELTPDQVAQAIRFTTIKPSERFNFLRRIEFLTPDQNPILESAGLKFKTEPLKIHARTLPAPQVLFRRRGGRDEDEVASASVQNGAWKSGDSEFRIPAKLRHWVVIVFGDDQTSRSSLSRAEVQDAISHLVRACVDLGLAIEDKRPEIFFTGRNHDVEGFIKDVGRQYHSRVGSVPQLLVCFLSVAGTNSPEHASVKKFGDMHFGVATQCLSIAKVKTKATLQYWQNVALKINPKLSGTNHTLHASDLQGFSDVPAMIMGADVTHPAPNSRDPSVSGIVATVDRHMSKYTAATRLQKSRQEHIDSLDEMTMKVLTTFQNVNKVLPEKLIVFRDGVSEGQYQKVLQHELPAIRQAFIDAGQPSIKITYVIAAKRHHYRFMPVDARDADKTGNCQAGLVVDTDITSPTQFDFYCQSQGGLLGTSRSAHYTVLLDENGFSANSLAQFTYNLCYTYARSTRSVSLVTPAYYAHHVCLRTRELATPNRDDDTSSVGDVSNFSRASQESEERRQRHSAFERVFAGVHVNMEQTLYFM